RHAAGPPWSPMRPDPRIPTPVFNRRKSFFAASLPAVVANLQPPAEPEENRYLPLLQWGNLRIARIRTYVEFLLPLAAAK
ncbi:MAG TPA: hypothetical protein VFW87_20270, partial [Pirellulales bacterium]|nr:hypothetical protein [Pirellulales bacterium]